MSSTDPQPGQVEAWQAGRRVGRYIAIELAGHGAMGIVVRAYDPKLQREVALKMLHRGGLTAEAHARMAREARAMARLHHPNVVAVYDVEQYEEGGVVVAMELVRGQTLAEWLHSRPPWRLVVEKFIAAGRGLVAAHDAEILHRDFKPSNVLIGEDGRARVTDFGLARTPGRDHSQHAGEWTPPAASQSSISLAALTATGAVIGTPKYMAPEQHQGEPLTVAADQYAFCVSLWEGLTGAAPFSGDPELLAQHKRAGPPTWPRDVACARHVVEAIRRGMQPDPAQRWSSMTELVNALAKDRRGVHRRAAVLAVAIAALAVTGVVVAGWMERRAQACGDAGAALAGAWSPDRAAATEGALLAASPGLAPVYMQRTIAGLDAYAKRWTESYTEACELTTIRGEQSAFVMDLRIACLRRAGVELRAAVDLLLDADAQVAQRAHEIVGGLPALHHCADVDALQSGVHGPRAAQQDDVDRIRNELARVRALRRAGKFDLAHEASHQAQREAMELGYGPLETEAGLELATLQAQVGEYAVSEATYRDVLRTATRWGQTAALARAASELIAVLAIDRGRPREAMLLLDLARGAVARSGDPNDEADVHDNVGLVLAAVDRHVDAEAEHRAALALRERAGSRGAETAESRTRLGAALYEQARYAEAEAEHRAALAILESVHGPEHPQVANTRNNLALALAALGEHADARAEYERALVVARGTFGPQHPTVGRYQLNLANLLVASGEPDRAAEICREVLTIFERTLGSDHPDTAKARHDLDSALSQLEQREHSASRQIAAVE